MLLTFENAIFRKEIVNVVRDSQRKKDLSTRKCKSSCKILLWWDAWTAYNSVYKEIQFVLEISSIIDESVTVNTETLVIFCQLSPFSSRNYRSLLNLLLTKFTSYCRAVTKNWKWWDDVFTKVYNTPYLVGVFTHWAFSF